MHTLPDFETGGGQKLLLRMLQNMPAGGCDHIVCSLGDGPMRPLYERVGVVTHVVGYRGLATLPSAIKAVIGLVRREGVSVLHTNSRLDRIVGHVAGYLSGTPVVTTYHSIVAQSGMTYPSVVRPLIRLVVRLMNIVLARMGVEAKVAVSAAVREARAKDLGCPPSDFAVIYPGLTSEAYADPPTPEQRQSVLRSLGVDGAGPILICVGRIVEQKGQHFLVRMLPLLLGKWPGLCLLVVGDGRDADFLEREIDSLGVRAAVRLLGNRDDVPALIAVSDILVHASLSEGFGLVVLEGMAAGKPVVASNLPSIAEFVDDGVTGFLVDSPEPRRLADAVDALLADGARRHAAGEAARVAAKRFDVRNMAAALSAIYERIARPRGH
jgi:glycosyltransferase involved in cell wall biosynthesis